MKLAALIAMVVGQPWMLDQAYVAAATSIAAAIAATRPDLNGELDVQASKPRNFGGPMALSGGKKMGETGRVLQVGNTAVIDVWGVLAKDPWYADTSYGQVRTALADAMAAWREGKVRHIVLRADSPGGEAIPVETAAAEIFAAAQEMQAAGKGDQLVTMGEGLVCSAMYYLASQTMAILTTKGSFTGSIGTRQSFANFKGLLDKLGIAVHTFASTPIKDAGSATRDMNEADRKVLQGEVDAFDRQFVDAVIRGRGVAEDTVRSWQTFRGLTGPAAAQAGLIDGVLNSTEQLVAMLNAPGGAERVAAMRKRPGMAVEGAGSGAQADVDVQNNQGAAPVAAPADAGNPAEGNVARRMMGIAGVAAGLALLDVDPPGGGGGGGGGGAATVTAGERDRIAAEAVAAANAANMSRINAIRAAAIPFAKNENIIKLSNEAIDKGWTVEAFNAEAMKSLAPKPIGPGPGQVGEGGANPTPTGDVSVGDEQDQKLGGAMVLAMVQRHSPDVVAALREGANASMSGPRWSKEYQRAEAARSMAEHWGFDTPAAALAALRSARMDGLAGLSLSDIALRSVAAAHGIDMATAMTRFSDKARLFEAAVRTKKRAGILAAQGGVGSSDFPNLFANVANKVMMASFALKAQIWDRFCVRGTANDFKPGSLVGISELGKFVQLPEGAPIPETKPVERKETIAVNKFGLGFSLTFETMVNDDLGVFLSVPSQVGMMAKYIPDDLVLALLALNANLGPTMVTDSVALYDAAHNNIGTGAALSYDAIRADRTKAAKQTGRGPDAVELDIDLSVWLVCTNQKDTLIDLSSQDYVPGTAGQQNQRNTLRGVIEPVWSNKLAGGGDVTRRYGFTKPGPNSAIEVRFLFGQDTPTIAVSNESDLTAQRYDAMVPGVGAAARSWEGTLTNAGV